MVSFGAPDGFLLIFALQLEEIKYWTIYEGEAMKRTASRNSKVSKEHGVGTKATAGGQGQAKRGREKQGLGTTETGTIPSLPEEHYHVTE